MNNKEFGKKLRKAKKLYRKINKLFINYFKNRDKMLKSIKK